MFVTSTTLVDLISELMNIFTLQTPKTTDYRRKKTKMKGKAKSEWKRKCDETLNIFFRPPYGGKDCSHVLY